VGLVSSRGRSASALLVAAGLTLLLASASVCLAVMYAQTVTQAGLSQLLASAPEAQRSVLVTAPLDDGASEQDASVRESLESAFAGTPVEVSSSVLSDPVVVRTTGTRGKEIQLLSGPELPARVRVVDGTWPGTPPSGNLPVAVSPASAAELGVEVGSPLQLEGMVGARVTAVIVPVDPRAPFWAGQGAALADGVDDEGREALGPLLTTAALSEALTRDAVVRWVAEPDPAEISVGRVPALRSAVAALDDGGVPAGAEVTTELADLLGDIEQPLLVARSSVYLPATLVVLSAGAALVLAAGLAGGSRRPEVRLMQARGFSRRQLLGIAGAEAVLVALPAAALAPLLARAALAAATRWGPLANAGITDLGSLGGSTWWLSAAIAATGAGLLVATGSGRGGGDERVLGLQRAGVDVAVVVLAALACWQLLGHGTPLSEDLQGRRAVDPVLVVAPALVLLAGGLVALRILPWAARRMDAAASAATGLATALGAWQVGRRPRRQAGPTLLVVLAVSVGALGATYAASWQRSQTDQADLAAGADLRVEAADPLQRSPGAAGAYAAVPGVAHAMAVTSRTIRLGEQRATLTAWDAAVAADVVPLRSDLVAGGDLARLGRELVSARPDATTVELPAGARSLRLTVRAAATAGEPTGGPLIGVPSEIELAVVLRDRAGLLHRLAAGAVPTDGAMHELDTALDDAGRTVSAGLLAVEATVETPPPVGLRGIENLPLLTVDIASAAVTIDPGRPFVPLPTGQGWRATTASGPLLSPSVELLEGGGSAGLLRLAARAGALPGPVTLSLRPVPTDAAGAGELTMVSPRTPVSAPVLLAPAAGDAAGNPLNATEMSLGAQAVGLEVIGQLDAIPGQGRQEGAGVVADLPGLSLALYEATGEVLEVDSWWLSTQPGGHAGAAAALADDDVLGPVTADRIALADQLRTEPLGVGVVGGMLLALAGAGLFAAIGVGVSAVVAIRERRPEFVLLRAVGTPSRQLSRSLAVEQSLLLGTGVVLGALLGAGVAGLLVPRLILDAGGRAPAPPVLVTLPWADLAALAGVVLAAVTLFVLLVARSLGRAAIAATLRFGDR
jgi:hypothetical protein